MIIKNSKVYDVLKAIALIWLPAAGTLYVTLGGVWSFENTQAVLGTIVAVDTFLGVVLGLSNASYQNSAAAYDGDVDVTLHPDGRKVVNINPDIDPATITSKKTLTLKVNPPQAPMPVQPVNVDADPAKDVPPQNNGY